MKTKKMPKTVFPGFSVQRYQPHCSRKVIGQKVIQDDNWRIVALGINRKYLIKYFSNIKLLSSQKMELFT